MSEAQKSNAGPADEKVSPRDRIVAAAEKIFAEKGLHGAALREIAREAKVNVNLIAYHFESKEALYQRAHEMRAAQINEMRELALADLDRAYSSGAPPVEQIIRAFIHPFFVLKSIDPEIWINFTRSYFREIGTDVWNQVNATSLSPAIGRFTTVLHRSLPAASRSDILFVLGLAIHGSMVAVDPDEATIVGAGLAADLSPDEMEERLVRSLTIVAQQYS